MEYAKEGIRKERFGIENSNFSKPLKI